MDPLFADDFVTIYHGDCLDVMRGMEPDSIDAIVTDPPYGLSFMGKDWDHGVPGEHFWHQALRVAKPGAHMVAFGGTRTHHRLMVAIEDAGWEIRDCLGYLYGSGFPKNFDVSKAIDREAGGEREVLGTRHDGASNKTRETVFSDDACSWKKEVQITAPATEAAAKWSGWGTSLKPAWEPVVLARKPLTGTVARNVQQWGTGALNIDGCRVVTEEPRPLREVHPLRDDVEYEPNALAGRVDGSLASSKAVGETTLGRWPANIAHDGSDEVLAVFPHTSSNPFVSSIATGKSHDVYGGGMEDYTGRGFNDSGSAARFFYTAKASKSERQEGIIDGRNTHPTVKPLDLMRWLVRLVTPPDGVVLDPFMGSGTTLKAARAEGHRSIGIDIEAAHCEIAWGRMSQGVLL